MSEPVNITVIVPRVRRALGGPTGAAVDLDDQQLVDVTADACADIILHTGSLFGHQLTVAATDQTTGAPTSYATSEALALHEQAVVACQAALTYFYFKLAGEKVSERIGDEAGQWEWAKSAQVIRDWLKYLQGERDAALARVTQVATLDTYSSFLAVRDAQTSRLVEGWGADEPGYGGMELPWSR